MQYLFGFSGRINRAKMWLFILVTLVWEIAVGLVAAAGLTWTHIVMHAAGWSQVGPNAGASFSAGFAYPQLGPIDNPLNWIALGIIALLVIAYFVSLAAVSTKRLHDRGKGAVWLVLFLLVPWGLGILKVVALPALFAFGPFFGPFAVGWGTAHLIGAVLGIWGFIELFCLSGMPGSNAYGPDPLAKSPTP